MTRKLIYSQKKEPVPLSLAIKPPVEHMKGKYILAAEHESAKMLLHKDNLWFAY